MKFNTIVNIIFLLGIIFSSSCKSVYKSNSSTTTRTSTIYGPGVIHKPMVGELSVLGNKVTSSKTGNLNQLDQLKEDVVAMTIREAQCDLLVTPTFSITQDGNEITVQVSGYPATYTKFREMNCNDKELLKIGVGNTVVLEEAKAEDPTDKKSNPKKGNGKKVVGVVLLTLGLTTLLATLGVLSSGY
jgi:hypothetical protein